MKTHDKPREGGAVAQLPAQLVAQCGVASPGVGRSRSDVAPGHARTSVAPVGDLDFSDSDKTEPRTTTHRTLRVTDAGRAALESYSAPVPYRLSHEAGVPLECISPVGMVP